MHFEANFGLDNKHDKETHSKEMLNFTFTFSALTWFFKCVFYLQTESHWICRWFLVSVFGGGGGLRVYDHPL